ncbi:MAG: hypothetical protein ACREGR_04570 [Minisyncoccia bacterium]
MGGYKVGDPASGLEEDGSFEVGLGVRGHAVIGETGQVLVADQATGKLVKDLGPSDPEE